jgi:16S rRNA (cytidine1402-2'-O)-methyltransferase
LCRGTAAAADEHFGAGRIRGEIVLLVASAVAGAVEPAAPVNSVEESLRKLRDKDLPLRQAVKRVAKEFGLPGDEVYRRALAMKDQAKD